MRKRILFFTVLPTVFLGVTYFFLVEYVAREFTLRSEEVRILRYGGGGVLLLFSLAALAGGAHLSDSIRRPLRMLSRISEGAEVAAEQTAHIPDSDPDLRFLFLRVHTLVQQNRSGAHTLGELEALKREVEEISEEIRRSNEGGALPNGISAAENGPAGPLTREIQMFVDRLRDDLDSIDRGLVEIAESLSEQEAIGARKAGDAEEAVRELERLGTVWSLAVEIARKETGAIPGEVGSCFHEFTGATRRLRETLLSISRGAAAAADVRSAAVTLRRTIADRLPARHGEETVAPVADPVGESE